MLAWFDDPRWAAGSPFQTLLLSPTVSYSQQVIFMTCRWYCTIYSKSTHGTKICSTHYSKNIQHWRVSHGYLYRSKLTHDDSREFRGRNQGTRPYSRYVEGYLLEGELLANCLYRLVQMAWLVFRRQLSFNLGQGSVIVWNPRNTILIWTEAQFRGLARGDEVEVWG